MSTMTERRRGERRQANRPIAQDRRARDRRMLARAMKARQLGYKPYDPVIVEEGRVLEAVGYPFHDGMGIAILAREWGDPTTTAKYRLLDRLPDVLIFGEETIKRGWSDCRNLLDQDGDVIDGGPWDCDRAPASPGGVAPEELT